MGKTFVVGDTHGFGSDFKKIKDWNRIFNKDLTKEDVLIQLGDAGWIWYEIGTNKDQEYWCNWLATRNYIIFIVLGNHCNYTEIYKLPETEMFGSKVYELKTSGRHGEGSIYFAQRGEIYTINEKKFWAFGGALSIDKDSRTPGVSWWEEELPTWYEYEYGMKMLDEVDWNVDYVLTHTCPLNIIGSIIHQTVYTEGKFNDPVAKYLYEVYKGLKFKSWFAGHFHTDIILDYSDTNDGIFHICYNNPPKEII